MSHLFRAIRLVYRMIEGEERVDPPIASSQSVYGPCLFTLFQVENVKNVDAVGPDGLMRKSYLTKTLTDP